MAKSKPTPRCFIYIACVGASLLTLQYFARCAATVVEESGNASSSNVESDDLTALANLEDASAKAAQVVLALQQSQELEKGLTGESLAICQKMMDLESGRAAMQSVYIKVVLMRPLATAYRQSYARYQVTAEHLQTALASIYPKPENGHVKVDSLLQEYTVSFIELGSELLEFSIKMLDLLSELMDVLVDQKTLEVLDFAGIEEGEKLLTDAAEQCQKTISTILNRKSEQEKKAVAMGNLVISTMVTLIGKEQIAEGGAAVNEKE